MSEKEFFAAREPAIASAPNAAARKRAIVALAEENPDLHGEFAFESRRGQAETSLIRGSGRFPLCATGKINTYSIFAEHFRATLAARGRSGIITPTGLATDATTAAFLADTVSTGRLASFYDFDNEAKIFDNVHHSFRFAVSSMTGGERVPEVRLAFVVRQVSDVPSRRFPLAAGEVLLLNPNTGTLPVFRSRRDAEVTLACYRRHPVLIRDGDQNTWGLRFSQGLFNMASDSSLFRTAEEMAAERATLDGWAWVRGAQRWLPLYEAKMLSHWNSRFSTYAGATQAQLNVGSLPRATVQQLNDPLLESLPRYWVADNDVRKALPSGWHGEWLLGFRRLTRASDVRTFIPFVAATTGFGDNAWIVFSGRRDAWLLHAVWSSLIADYIVRQKLSGTTLSAYIVEQLACPKPSVFDDSPGWFDAPLSAFVRPRVRELAYTSHLLAPYAVDVLDGVLGETDPGPPFRWLPARRDQLRAELDAAMLHLYGLSRDDAEHVLDSFPVLRRFEERDHDEFRTKRLVLSAYDAMVDAEQSGTPFVSPLDPAPGAGPRHPEQPR